MQLFTTKKEPEIPIYLEDIRDPLTLDQPKNIQELVKLVQGNFGVIKNPSGKDSLEDSSMKFSDISQRNFQNYYLDDNNVRINYRDHEDMKFLGTWEAQMFQFIGSMVAFISSAVGGYIINKQSKLAATVTSMALHKLSGAHGSPTELTSEGKTTQVICQNMTLGIIITCITIFGVIIYIIKIVKTLTFCKGHKYSNIATLYMFASREDRFLALKLASVKGHVTKFSITGCLTTKNITLTKSKCWDIIQINWETVEILYNDKPINIPSDIFIPLLDRIRARYILNSPNPEYTFLVKQGHTWYDLVHEKYQRNPGVPEIDE
jgi:hypothetical protein